MVMSQVHLRKCMHAFITDALLKNIGLNNPSLPIATAKEWSL